MQDNLWVSKHVWWALQIQSYERTAPKMLAPKMLYQGDWDSKDGGWIGPEGKHLSSEQTSLQISFHLLVNDNSIPYK